MAATTSSSSSSGSMASAPQHSILRKTKIVATLGPASTDKIKELIQAGVNIFRINFSHAQIEDQLKVISDIRKFSAELNVSVGILGDLPGPKVRCGVLKDHAPIKLEKGQTVRLRASKEPGEPGLITTPIQEVVTALSEGHAVLMDDGNLKIRVTKRINEHELECVVEVGGLLKERKGINVPDVKLGLSAVTESDKKNAKFILEQKLDFIAVSFVQRAEDLHELRAFIDAFNKDKAPEDQWYPHLVSKIEKPQAIDDLDSILEATDAVMVARGDLGLECSLEMIPIFQKLIIDKSNVRGKPVITATQMLETMMNAPIPTRAEVSDIANAIYDGTDAVMLSGESAAGKYPVESVAMMASICEAAEQKHNFIRRTPRNDGDTSDYHVFLTATANAAVSCATTASAKAIVAFTGNGEIAGLVSKMKYSKPIIAVTFSRKIYGRLSICWGVYPLLLELPTRYMDTDNLLAMAELEISKKDSWVKQGEPVVMMAGLNESFTSLTHSIQILHFGQVTKSIQNRQKWQDMLSHVSHAIHSNKQQPPQ